MPWGSTCNAILKYKENTVIALADMKRPKNKNL